MKSHVFRRLKLEMNGRVLSESDRVLRIDVEQGPANSSPRWSLVPSTLRIGTTNKQTNICGLQYVMKDT